MNDELDVSSFLQYPIQALIPKAWNSGRLTILSPLHFTEKRWSQDSNTGLFDSKVHILGPSSLRETAERVYG